MALAFEPQLRPPAHFNPYGAVPASPGVPAKGNRPGGFGYGRATEATLDAATSSRGVTAPASTGRSVVQGHPVNRMTYHWRRAGAVVVVLLALYMAWLMVAMIGGWLVTTAEASDSLAPAPAMEYVVEPGDTLWTVAATIDTDRDIRAVVADLIDANGGVDVHPGQILDLEPAYR